MTAQKLDIRAFAIACGVSWGLGMLALGLAARLLGMGTPLVGALGSLYLGFTPTFTGAAIGTVWAFVDGAIGGAIIAAVYNCAMKCRVGSDAE